MSKAYSAAVNIFYVATVAFVLGVLVGKLL